VNAADQRRPALILVEDNETLREELAHYLSEEGFSVRGVDWGRELDAALVAHHTDILILDLNLPEEEGNSITKRIRASMPHLGIIVLTARVRSIDRLEAYAAGADVYLTKPTRPEELTSVVNNLFARLGPPKKVAHWQLDTIELTLLSPEGKLIKLTEGEALLLRELALHEQFADHWALISHLGDARISEKINKARIEVLVSRLRNKLEHHFDIGISIKALRGRGYRLGFPVVVKNPS
jgi:DNA-binding response OmpR family regulator